MAKSKTNTKSPFLGDFKEKNFVSHRFIEAYNKLKQLGVFSSYEDFSAPYGYGKDVMAKIATGVQDVPTILLWAMVTDYGVDANFFFNDHAVLKAKNGRK
jgi:hypothetical protein